MARDVGNISQYNNNSVMRFIVNNSLFRRFFYDVLPYSMRAFLSQFVFHPHFGPHMIKTRGVKFYYGHVSFGEGTRIAGNSVFANMTVGKYTVFAEGFRRIAFIHNYNAFSINNEIINIIPEIKKMQHKLSEDTLQPRIDYYDNVTIGNDVWIGEFVTVLGNVTIGDGAVIAARSIVTHDVPPFAIYGGVPARFIKWRFDQDKIDLMSKLEWWNWEPSVIAENYERLCSFDPTLLNDINAN